MNLVFKEQRMMTPEEKKVEEIVKHQFSKMKLEDFITYNESENRYECKLKIVQSYCANVVKQFVDDDNKKNK